MPAFLFHTSDDQLNALRQLSQETKVSVAEYLRRGANLVLSGGVQGSVIVSGQLVSGVMLVIKG